MRCVRRTDIWHTNVRMNSIRRRCRILVIIIIINNSNDESIRGRCGFDLVGALSNASVSLARSPEGPFFVVATTVVVMVVQRLFLLLALRERRERERDSFGVDRVYIR